MHSGVSIASLGKASIVFAKAFASVRSSRRLCSYCTIDTAYFVLLFLIHSLNRLERDNARCQTLALRQLFLSTLYHWFSAASDELLSELSADRESLRKVVAVELLRNPFYLCVSLHIPILLSVEMYH